jgi:hypothetical protein
MDTHAMLRTLVQRVGASVFADADELRSVLDDFTSDADLAPGQQNLLVDAVRLGGYEHLHRMISSGADPADAVAAAGDRLAQERGSTDPTGARWACAAIGFAAGFVPEELVRHYFDLPGGPGSMTPVIGFGAAGATYPGAGRPPDAPDATGESESAAASPSPLLGAQPSARPPHDAEHPPPQPLGPTRVTRSDETGRRRTLIIASAGLFLLVAAFAAVALWTDLLPGGEPNGEQSGPDGDGTSGPGGGGGNGDGGNQPPVQAPFESVDMWAMAWPYFDPVDCKVPTTKAEAPVAWPLDWRELVKCVGDDYSGTFLCTDNSAQLAEARSAFLKKAVDTPRPLDGHPADQPAAPFQVAFHHEGSGTRAYWDSPAQLCLAELQSTSADISAVIRIWRDGMPN